MKEYNWKKPYHKWNEKLTNFVIFIVGLGAAILIGSSLYVYFSDL